MKRSAGVRKHRTSQNRVSSLDPLKRIPCRERCHEKISLAALQTLTKQLGSGTTVAPHGKDDGGVNHGG